MDFIRFVGDDGSPTVTINNQAAAAKVPPCALAAIGSRETNFRNVFQEGVPRGPGCGVGDCQITYNVDWANPDHPTYAGRDLTDRSQNYYVAARVFLAPAIKVALLLRERHGEQMNEINSELLYFAYCVYNAGEGAVEAAVIDGRDPDGDTTDGYAHDTLRRYHEYVVAAHHAAIAKVPA